MSYLRPARNLFGRVQLCVRSAGSCNTVLVNNPFTAYGKNRSNNVRLRTQDDSRKYIVRETYRAVRCTYSSYPRTCSEFKLIRNALLRGDGWRDRAGPRNIRYDRGDRSRDRSTDNDVVRDRTTRRIVVGRRTTAVRGERARCSRKLTARGW